MSERSSVSMMRWIVLRYAAIGAKPYLPSRIVMDSPYGVICQTVLSREINKPASICPQHRLKVISRCPVRCSKPYCPLWHWMDVMDPITCEPICCSEADKSFPVVGGNATAVRPKPYLPIRRGVDYSNRVMFQTICCGKVDHCLFIVPRRTRRRAEPYHAIRVLTNGVHRAAH